MKNFFRLKTELLVVGLLAVLLVVLMALFKTSPSSETEKVSEDLSIRHWSSAEAECYILSTKKEIPVGFSCFAKSNNK